MLMPKSLLESALPANLRQLVDQGNVESLRTVAENLESSLIQVNEEIASLGRTHAAVLQPEIEKTERLVAQIHSLHEQVARLNAELKENEKLIKNVSEIDEFKRLIDRIELINKIIVVVKFLQKFDEQLEEFKSAVDAKDYAKCDELLTKLGEIERQHDLPLSESELDEVVVYKEIREEFVMHRERLWYELDQEWDRMVQIEPTQGFVAVGAHVDQPLLDKLTQFSKHKATGVSPDTKRVSFVFAAKMSQLAKKFLLFCEERIIAGTHCELHTLVDGHANKLSFRPATTTARDLDEEATASATLDLKLRQVEQTLAFLVEHLLGMRVFVHNGGTATLMSLFSELVVGGLVTLVYERLVVSVIPLRRFDCRLEERICERVASFERALQAIGFVECSSPLFATLVNNVEELYVRKKCKWLMETSRERLRRDDLLFEAVRVEERREAVQRARQLEDAAPATRLIADLLGDDDASNYKLSGERTTASTGDLGLLLMPACSVSRACRLLVDAVYETLDEAVRMLESTATPSVKNVAMLCLVAKNLLELYGNVVPTQHRDNLERLPLFAALVHNDLVYLAVHSLTLTHQYKRLFARGLANRRVDLDELVANFSCLDLVPKLCCAANRLLAKQVDAQQLLLMQFLHEDSPGVKDLSEANNYALFTKALNKCALQLNNLATAWLGVLPPRLYSRVFGQLLNALCADQLRACLKLEDISSDDASCLHEAFSLVKQTVYAIFTKQYSSEAPTSDTERHSNNHHDNDESSQLVKMSVNNNLAEMAACKYVECWPRFKYLLVILKVSLQEIVDLWSERQGPLALHFDSEEVRSLIKALFMITDKRSAALAKIM